MNLSELLKDARKWSAGLYKTATNMVNVVGFCFVVVLAAWSMTDKPLVLSSLRLDTLTQGSMRYIWWAIALVYGVGSFVQLGVIGVKVVKKYRVKKDSLVPPARFE